MTLAVAAPAMADVRITSGDNVQGGPGKLTFEVTNDQPTAAMTRIEVRLPDRYPIAEVVAMSVQGWAPAETTRKIDGALVGLHGGQTSDVVSSINWVALPGNELPPGGKLQIQVSIFAVPATDTLVVGAVQTYSDGTVVNYTGQPGAALAAGERPAPTASLKPPVANAAEVEEPVAGDGAADPADGEGSNLMWMFALLVLIGAITAFALVRQRRSEPASAGTKSEESRKEHEKASR